jgi:hypothetical protein
MIGATSLLPAELFGEIFASMLDEPPAAEGKSLIALT